MIILSVTLVPFFHHARVYTAYEYLERRFDAKTRTFTSLLFLLSRGAVVRRDLARRRSMLSIMLGWNLTLTVLAIGLPTAIYTMFGGVQAVTWTDVKQMVLIVFGLLAAVVVLIVGPAARRQRRPTRCTSPARPAGCRRSTSASTRPRPTRSGRASSAGCSCAVVLRHRPEPGAALPHGEVGGRRRARRC